MDTTLVLLCYKEPIEDGRESRYRVGDECYPSEHPDGRGHLSIDPVSRGWQTSYSRDLSQPRPVALPAQAGPESQRPDSGALLAVRWREWQWTGIDGLTSKLALHRTGETQESGVARGGLAHRAQPFPPTDLCLRSRRGCGRSAGPRGAAEGTVRQLPQQLAGDGNPQGGDGGGVMPFGANAATLAGESPAAAPGLIIQDGRRGLRG